MVSPVHVRPRSGSVVSGLADAEHGLVVPDTGEADQMVGHLGDADGGQ